MADPDDVREELDPNLFGPEQRCFGCGPHNEHGMQLRFTREGDSVVTVFTAREGWEGPPGIVHGGLQATLADEVGAWTVVGVLGCFGLTSSMQLRYLRPARMDQPIEGRGRLVEHGDGRARVRVTLSQDGKRLLSGTVMYAMPTQAQAERVLGQELPEAWVPLTRPEPS